MSDTKFNQSKQAVNNQINIGRDQIIQNLVLVGQFLDFAKVEGLIPKATEPRNFDDIVDGLDKSINERMNSDLADAAVFAGEVLKPIIIRYKPKSRFEVLSTQKIMKELPKTIGATLLELGYWEAFKLPGLQKLKLESTEQMFTKHLQKKININLNLVGGAFVFENVDLTISQDEFRIFMVGVVIDLMRLYTKGSIGTKFWHELANVLSSNSEQD